MPKANLLLVEDNPYIQMANRDMLVLLDYEVAVAGTLREARTAIARRLPDAIVLDLMLPDGNGLDFLADLRQQQYTMPVLILTALGTEADTVAGLVTGADDYLAKPYSYPVLAARIEALLRRVERVSDSLRKGSLHFNILSGQVTCDEKDMLLTGKEFSCLLLLAQYEGGAVPSKTIYETVWKMPFAQDSQALRSMIARLRSKLAGSGYSIVAQRGEGYRFQQEKD